MPRYLNYYTAYYQKLQVFFSIYLAFFQKIVYNLWQELIFLIVSEKISENFVILQDTEKFKYGTDAVLLADFANIKKHDTVVDLCSGTGAVGFLAFLRCSQKHTTFVDIDSEMVELSEKTAELNNISDKFSFIFSDIKNLRGIESNSVDYITVNPPYFRENSGKINKNENIVNARHAYDFSLSDLFSISYKLLKDGGKVAIIQRADYLSEVIFEMKKNRIEPKRLRLIQSYSNKSANLFLLEGVKNGGIELKCLPTLVLYNDKGMTEEFEKIQNARFR